MSKPPYTRAQARRSGVRAWRRNGEQNERAAAAAAAHPKNAWLMSMCTGVYGDVDGGNLLETRF